MLVLGCVGDESNHGNETIFYFVLLRLEIYYSILDSQWVEKFRLAFFCILEPLKNGGCQQLLNWRLLQKPCYWLFCILHVHHATKHSLNYVLYLSLLVSLTLVRLMKLTSLNFKNICFKYETPWWMFPWNCGRGEKQFIFFFWKGVLINWNVRRF